MAIPFLTWVGTLLEALNCEFGIKWSVRIQRGQRRWIRRGNFFYKAACINKCAEQNYFPLNLARIYFKRTLPSTPLLHINKHASQNQVASKNWIFIFFASTIFNTRGYRKGQRCRKGSSFHKVRIHKTHAGQIFQLLWCALFLRSYIPDTVLNSFANSTFLKNASLWMGAHAKSPHTPSASALAFLFSALAYKKKR
jgi:hypothetical protein